MPTYEYRCHQGHHFELFQKMSDEPRAECPVCGADSERLLSAGAGFLFKGNGFYVTDYRSDSYKQEASKDESGGTPEKEATERPEKAKEAPSLPSKAKEASSGSSSSGGPSSEGS